MPQPHKIAGSDLEYLSLRVSSELKRDISIASINTKKTRQQLIIEAVEDKLKRLRKEGYLG